MEVYQLSVSKKGDVTVTPQSVSIILKPNSIVMAENLLIESMNNEVRITKVTDLDEAKDLLKQERPLEKALKNEVSNGHVFSNNCAVFDFDVIQKLAETDEEFILNGLMDIVSDNQYLFTDENQANVQALQNAVQSLAEVYNINYILIKLGAMGVAELKSVVESEEPVRIFSKIVSGEF